MLAYKSVYSVFKKYRYKLLEKVGSVDSRGTRSEGTTKELLLAKYLLVRNY